MGLLILEILLGRGLSFTFAKALVASVLPVAPPPLCQDASGSKGLSGAAGHSE